MNAECFLIDRSLPGAAERIDNVAEAVGAVLPPSRYVVVLVCDSGSFISGHPDHETAAHAAAELLAAFAPDGAELCFVGGHGPLSRRFDSVMRVRNERTALPALLRGRFN